MIKLLLFSLFWSHFFAQEKQFVKCSRAEVLRYQLTGKSDNLRLIERLRRSKKKKTETYFSSSGRFKVLYDIEGSDAVPLTDANLNTIPDYVEWTAQYAEESYQKEVKEAGFFDPFESFDFVTIRLENTGGDYGYTESNGHTIAIENDFVGFPNNDDPEGNQKGALRVTIAHEFKHVIQFVTDKQLFLDFNDYWVETDAVWAEEFVYPQVNDFYNYLTQSSSQIAIPSKSMNDRNGTGTYEDVIWNLYLEQNFTANFLVNFWKRRNANPQELVLDTYKTMINNYASSMETSILEYTAWNFLTKERAANLGYIDAENYPLSSSLSDSIHQADYTEFSRSISSFASRHYYLNQRNTEYIKVKGTSANEAHYLLVGVKLNQDVEIQVASGEKGISTQLPSNQYKDIALLLINTNTNGASKQAATGLSSVATAEENSELGRKENKQNLIGIKNQIVSKLLTLLVPEKEIGKSYRLRIYNVLGQKMDSYIFPAINIVEILDISTYSSGAYFIQAESGGNYSSLKFIKIR